MPTTPTTKHPSGADAIRAAFARASGEGRCARLPFITGGYPTQGEFERLLRELPAAGADLVEIGFPFSDPIADGPVIAESMHQALLGGVTPDTLFETVARVGCQAPLVAMVSVSIVDRMGAMPFITRCVEAGFSGIIVPDADPESAERLAAIAKAAGAGYCALIAPTTTDQRLRSLAGISSGFIYLLARAGVTGERTDAPDVAARVAQVRAVSSAPIAVGFGISTAEHVRSVGMHADGAIVGSAIVRRMTEATQRGESAAEAALSLVRSLGA